MHFLTLGLLLFFLHINSAFSMLSVNDSSLIVSVKKKFIAIPAVIKSPETRLGLGVGASYFFRTQKNDTVIRTSNIEFLALQTFNKQTIIVLGGNVYFPKEKYILRWRNSFSHFPDKFWGIGNNTPRENKEKYIFTQYLINPVLLRKVYKTLFIGIGYEFQHVFNVSYLKNGLFDKENVTGRYGGNVSGVGVTISWDTRNNAFSSTRGEFLQFTINNFQTYTGSQFVFTNYIFDARKYFKTTSKHVLGFQMFGNFNVGKPPIRNLAALGGSDIMRGFYSGRYRDKNLVAIQTEYRMPLIWRIGIVAFGALGEVSDKIGDIRLQSLKYGIGGGIRFALKEKERLNIRIDYGVGKHSKGTYITVSEAF